MWMVGGLVLGLDGCGAKLMQAMEDRMSSIEVGVGAAADAAYTAKRREEMAASEAAAEIQRMKRGYLIKVS